MTVCMPVSGTYIHLLSLTMSSVLRIFMTIMISDWRNRVWSILIQSISHLSSWLLHSIILIIFVSLPVSRICLMQKLHRLILPIVPDCLLIMNVIRTMQMQSDMRKVLTMVPILLQTIHPTTGADTVMLISD